MNNSAGDVTTALDSGQSFGDGFNWHLYPLADNEFAIKKFDFTISFGEGSLCCLDEEYRKV